MFIPVDDIPILNIEYNYDMIHNIQDGMKIDLNHFFPTTIKNYRKLIQTIEMDWKKSDELFFQLKDFIFKELSLLRIKADADKTKLTATEHKLKTLTTIIKSNTGYHGEPLSKDEIKQIKQDHRDIVIKKKTLENDLKENQKAKVLFRKYFTILEEKVGGKYDLRRN